MPGKAAMMVAVARHIACVPASRIYYDKKRVEGKKHNQAIRSLGRHLVRVIWAMVKQGRNYEMREKILENLSGMFKSSNYSHCGSI